MVVVFNQGNIFRATPNGTSMSQALSLNTGTDRFFILGARNLNGGTVDSLTYAGITMTNQLSIQQGGGGPTSKLWSLVNHATGSNTIAATYSTYGSAYIQWATFTGVDQTTPLGSMIATSGNTLIAETPYIPMPVDGALFSNLASDYTQNFEPITTTETKIQWLRDASAGHNHAIAYSTQQLDTSNNRISFAKWKLSAVVQWIIMSVVINPSTTAKKTYTFTYS